jgi:protein-tyrosine phosphatase
MIDFHSHILPDIDDGSASMEETISILEEAQKAGFTKIISTSHFIEQYYEFNEKQRTELINKVRQAKPDMDLFLGSEIYISDEMVDLLEQKKASTINDSKYVLFELPMNVKRMNTKEIVYILIQNNYIPIIAHPERYSYVQENIEYVKELSDMGALFQANYGSLIGMYGRKAESTVKKLLKKDLIHFLGTDVHRVGQVYNKMPKIMKKLRKTISEDKIEELTTINPQIVLDNREI